VSATTIADVRALEIIDDRGRPTIRTTVRLGSGTAGRADVPCGSSTGSYEAFDLRDGGDRYGGWGVRRAIANVHEVLRPALLGRDAADQRLIDETLIELDGTRDKSRLGGNAILSVSLAAARAAAAGLELPLYRHLGPDGHVLPVPQASLINGGLHAGNDLDVQEFCVMPVGSRSATEAIRLLCEVFAELRALLRARYGAAATNFSEDGGFAPPLSRSREAMDALCEAVSRAGYEDEVVYALDVAATGLYDADAATYRFDGRARTRDEMVAALSELVREFPGIVSIEDPLDQDDLEGWRLAVEGLPGVLVVGDDLTATNPERLRAAIDAGAITGALCKVNQIGTLSEAMDAARYTAGRGCPVVLSVRSGETEDDILSDVSVALNAGLFKTGGIHGSDRGANYNRFLEIEAELGAAARYAGRDYARLD
jgi:enolase